MVLPSHLIRHYSFCPPMRIIKLYGLKSATKLRNLFHITKPASVSNKSSSLTPNRSESKGGFKCILLAHPQFQYSAPIGDRGKKKNL